MKTQRSRRGFVGWVEARGPQRGITKRPYQQFRRLRLEPLEDRRLLSVAAGQQVIELFGISPALFVENQGQWADESVRFMHQGDGVNVAMTDAGPVFQLFRSEPSPASPLPLAGEGRRVRAEPFAEFAPDPTGGSLRSATSHPDSYESTQISVRFDGANTVVPVGLDRAETQFNYFIGEQENWRSEVPAYEVVAYPGLYDGIDLNTWGRRDHLKYEFEVAPGADYRQIQLSYEGIDRLWLDDAGAMHVEAKKGTGPIYRDGPQRASHKLDLSPFSLPCETWPSTLVVSI